MLRKHMIAIIVTSVLAGMAVMYMYSKNYISFESGLHITFAQEPDDGYVETEFVPANTNVVENLVEPEIIEPVSKVQPMTRSSSNDVSPDEGRFFDDFMKFIETIMPLATVLIPIYLMKKNKNKVKAADA